MNVLLCCSESRKVLLTAYIESFGLSPIHISDFISSQVELNETIVLICGLFIDVDFKLNSIAKEALLVEKLKKGFPVMILKVIDDIVKPLGSSVGTAKSTMDHFVYGVRRHGERPLRSTERKDLFIKVHYASVENESFSLWADNSVKQFFSYEEAFTVNLSLEGAFLSVSNPYRLGPKIAIKANFIDPRQPVFAEIQWVVNGWEHPNLPPGVGVKFLGLNSEQRHNLQRTILEGKDLKSTFAEVIQRQKEYGIIDVKRNG